MIPTDLNLLIALDALIAQASVAGAARRLGLSASAMSRTLTRLRQATGDPLLVRAGRQMVLTPCAEALRERVRNVVHEARSVLRPSVPELDLARLERDFTLRANEGFIEACGAALIDAVTTEAPLVRLRFAPKVERSPLPLREGSADLEIGMANEMGPEVRLQTLFRDRFVGAVRIGHPLASLRRVTAERYCACQHVSASPRGDTSSPLDAALAERGLTRKVVAVVPSYPGALAIVRASDLVTIVPSSFLTTAGAPRTDGSASGIHRFELPVVTEPIIVSLMWHPRVELDPAHRWLRDKVRAVCATLARRGAKG
ncbi:LysR family transcriptional regulator [Herbaspirillum rubrisubalbicans]|uniref:LysR family transcriptional regulator n=1 Tax=Herbaspirillum rubrisubalbicans TaxID=80842 RepID=A0AAD0U406_9BURK|nr:LysR family transcriptional regulator [Herbaspirillum rubrisubalbicans]ALU87744.1 transcription regulator protein [Herbaspirillum rubrisubalbicans M1]AYR22798.1 LysR family transcriptional regulator [Herbaspirillum rubrisubalbicans]